MPDHDVFRLNVSMDYSCLMCRRQSRGCLHHRIEHLCQFYLRTGHALAKSYPVDKFGRNETGVVRLSNFINGQNVWVIECRCGISLLLEAKQSVFVETEI